MLTSSLSKWNLVTTSKNSPNIKFYFLYSCLWVCDCFCSVVADLWNDSSAMLVADSFSYAWRLIMIYFNLTYYLLPSHFPRLFHKPCSRVWDRTLHRSKQNERLETVHAPLSHTAMLQKFWYQSHNWNSPQTVTHKNKTLFCRGAMKLPLILLEKYFYCFKYRYVNIEHVINILQLWSVSVPLVLVLALICPSWNRIVLKSRMFRWVYHSRKSASPLLVSSCITKWTSSHMSLNSLSTCAYPGMSLKNSHS